MGILKRFFSFLSNPTQVNNDREYWVNVKCNRCGEEISTRIDLWNELSWSEPDAESSSAYTCRKIIMGSGTCFQKVEAILEFDSKRKLISSKITGGKLIDPE